jgi:hypothetical protein
MAMMGPLEAVQAARSELKSCVSIYPDPNDTEIQGECRIGAAAPMSDELRSSRSLGMATSTRDRITVDLGPLRPRLLQASQRCGRTPSALVKAFVASGLGEEQGAAGDTIAARGGGARTRSRICLRMPANDCTALKQAAAAAALEPGRFVALLVAGVAPAAMAADRPAVLAALRDGNVELSHLSRSIRHLTALLSQGSGRAAHEYRDMLDHVERDVRGYLRFAAEALREFHARRPGAAARRSRRVGSQGEV